MISLNYLMDHILYLKLLGTKEKNTKKGKNGENVSHLETTEVVVVHIDIVNKYYQPNYRVLSTFIPKFVIY